MCKNLEEMTVSQNTAELRNFTLHKCIQPHVPFHIEVQACTRFIDLTLGLLSLVCVQSVGHEVIDVIVFHTKCTYSTYWQNTCCQSRIVKNFLIK